MNATLRIGVPHREQGSPSRPYASRLRAKYPLRPSTFTYSASKLVPPTSSARRITAAVASSSASVRARLTRDPGVS